MPTCIKCQNSQVKLWFLNKPDGSFAHGYCKPLTEEHHKKGTANYELISLDDECHDISKFKAVE